MSMMLGHAKAARIFASELRSKALDLSREPIDHADELEARLIGHLADVADAAAHRMEQAVVDSALYFNEARRVPEPQLGRVP